MHVFVIESAFVRQNKIPIFYSIGIRQKFDLFKVSFILWPLKYFFVHSILAGLSLTLLAIQYKIFSPFRRNLSVCRSLVNETYTIANGQPTHKCRGVSAWLCLACCGFGIWCHLYSFPLGHTYTNQWDTPISNSLDSRTHKKKNNRIIRFRFICVHVVLQIRIQDRERCGLFAPYLPKAASIACLCACMRVCVWVWVYGLLKRIRAKPEHYDLSIINGKTLSRNIGTKTGSISQRNRPVQLTSLSLAVEFLE